MPPTTNTAPAPRRPLAGAQRACPVDPDDSRADPHARVVGRGGLDPVQREIPERERDHLANSRRGKAAAVEALSDPITEVGAPTRITPAARSTCCQSSAISSPRRSPPLLREYLIAHKLRAGRSESRHTFASLMIALASTRKRSLSTWAMRR